MPRTAAANEQIRDERREQILRAALRVFARKGLAAAKITDIGAAAGLSHGLVYHYFPSKEALYVELVERAMLGSLRLAEQALHGRGEPGDRLRWLCEEFLAGMRDQPDFALLIVQTYTSDAVPPEARAAEEREGEQIMRNVVELIRRGQEAGQVVAGDASELAIAFLAAIQGLTITQATEPGRRPLPRAGTILRLLGVEAAG